MKLKLFGKFQVESASIWLRNELTKNGNVSLTSGVRTVGSSPYNFCDSSHLGRSKVEIHSHENRVSNGKVSRSFKVSMGTDVDEVSP